MCYALCRPASFRFLLQCRHCPAALYLAKPILLRWPGATSPGRCHRRATVRPQARVLDTYGVVKMRMYTNGGFRLPSRASPLGRTGPRQTRSKTATMGMPCPEYPEPPHTVIPGPTTRPLRDAACTTSPDASIASLRDGTARAVTMLAEGCIRNRGNGIAIPLHPVLSDALKICHGAARTVSRSAMHSWARWPICSGKDREAMLQYCHLMEGSTGAIGA
jgi:hypothetical protein